MKGILSKKIIFSLFVFLAFPFYIHAQTLDLRSSSLYPSTGDNVLITLSSSTTDINGLEVSWYKDGKLDKKGAGLKNYNFIVGDKGNTIRAAVKVGTQVLDQSIKISPSSMDVLWEVSGGYEPPFYKGKVMPIKGSSIRVVAIPQIKNEKGLVLDSKSFVYAWKKDGSNFPGQSGYGLNSFVYSPQILDRNNTIEVSASGFSRSLLASSVISPLSSEIHFYEYSLAYGPLYNRAIKTNQVFAKRNLNIIAEPYFIFTNNLADQSLTTEWKVNSVLTNTEDKNILLLNIADNVNKIDLSFKTNNKNQLLQENSRPLRLNILKNE